MALPTTIEALLVIILVFVPGYIFLQFTKNAVAFVPQSADARYFLAVVAWGVLFHCLASPFSSNVVTWYRRGDLGAHMTYLVFWGLLTQYGVPFMCGVLGSWCLQTTRVDRVLQYVGMDYVSRTPSAWNYSTKLGATWCRVYLRDGTVIGGLYGDRSFADDSDEKDIFLEAVYNLDVNLDFTDPVRDSAGIWIAHDTISHVMYFLDAQEEKRHVS